VTRVLVTKAERVLHWRARPAKETVVDSARCLLAFGTTP
jgi:hypothetical protein